MDRVAIVTEKHRRLLTVQENNDYCCSAVVRKTMRKRKRFMRLTVESAREPGVRSQLTELSLRY